jgi:Tfp pilus assembly protein PilN
LRPANLIPPEQRKGRFVPGAARPRRAVGVYLLLAGLGFALLGVTALVLTSNKVNDHKEQIGRLQREEASAKSAADALRPYGNFAQMQRARIATVKSLVGTSFNWERVMRSLTRTLPSDAWLVSFKGSVSPDVTIEGGEGAASGLRNETQSPAIELVGCTYSHRAVARMMTRMRNLDGVTQVVLGDSERPEGKQDQGAQGGGAGGGESAGEDCRTKYSITKFNLLVVLGEAPYSKPGSVSMGGGSGAATPIASAQSATSTANEASAAAAGAGQ